MSAKITGKVAAQLLSKMVGGGGRMADQIQIISAFDTPSIKFDSIRKAFYQAHEGRTLHGTAQVSQQQLFPP